MSETEMSRALDALFEFAPAQFLSPPIDISMFAHRAVLGAEGHDGAEHRDEVRIAVSLPIVTVPVDESLRKTGEGFNAFTRDISSGGLAIYHTRHIAEKFLALEIKTTSGRRLRMLLHVLRCSRVGLFYEIAGRFVSRLGE